MAAREEIVGIQYLRGIAAVAVVLDHAARMAASDRYFGQRLFGGIVESGRYGVDLFFIISGFIIAVVSLQGPGLSAMPVREFFVRRFTRIVPLMWIAIVAYAALRFAESGVWDGKGYLRAMLLLPWGTPHPSHIWTLRQELIFYIVFALTMLTKRPWWFLLPLWVIGAFLASPILPHLPTLIRGPVRFLFHPANIEFAAGLLLAILWLRRTQGFSIRLPADPLLILATTSGVVIWGLAPLLGIGSGVYLALLLTPLVFLAIHVECPPGSLRRFGETLGNASYSIYLFHLPILFPLVALWKELAPGTAVWVVVLGCSVGSTAIGVAIHFILERPLIAALRRRFEPRTVDKEPGATDHGGQCER